MVLLYFLKLVLLKICKGIIFKHKKGKTGCPNTYQFFEHGLLRTHLVSICFHQPTQHRHTAGHHLRRGLSWFEPNVEEHHHLRNDRNAHRDGHCEPNRPKKKTRRRKYGNKGKSSIVESKCFI